MRSRSLATSVIEMVSYPTHSRYGSTFKFGDETLEWLGQCGNGRPWEIRLKTGPIEQWNPRENWRERKKGSFAFCRAIGRFKSAVTRWRKESSRQRVCPQGAYDGKLGPPVFDFWPGRQLRTWGMCHDDCMDFVCFFSNFIWLFTFMLQMFNKG